MFVPSFLARAASILRSSGSSQMAILVFLGSLWFGIIQILSAMYSPRVLTPRRLSSRSHSSWVIVTDLRRRVRPLPLPALRPAPLRLPPCVGFFFILKFLDLVVVCFEQTLGGVNITQCSRVPPSAHFFVSIVTSIVEKFIEVWIVERYPNGFLIPTHGVWRWKVSVLMVLKECPRQTNKAVFVNAGSVSCHGRGWFKLDGEGGGCFFMGQDDVSPAIEVGMATRGRLPAIQEGFSRTGTEWGFSSATSGNPISLFGFGGDLGDELVDGLLHFFWLVCRWRCASDLQPIYTILISRQYTFSNYFNASRNRMDTGSAVE